MCVSFCVHYVIFRLVADKKQSTYLATKCNLIICCHYQTNEKRKFVPFPVWIAPQSKWMPFPCFQRTNKHFSSLLLKLLVIWCVLYGGHWLNYRSILTFIIRCCWHFFFWSLRQMNSISKFCMNGKLNYLQSYIQFFVFHLRSVDKSGLYCCCSEKADFSRWTNTYLKICTSNKPKSYKKKNKCSTVR